MCDLPLLDHVLALEPPAKAATPAALHKDLHLCRIRNRLPRHRSSSALVGEYGTPAFPRLHQSTSRTCSPLHATHHLGSVFPPCPSVASLFFVLSSFRAFVLIPPHKPIGQLRRPGGL